MMNAGARAPVLRNQAVLSLAVIVFALVAAWNIGGWIANGEIGNLTLLGVGIAVCLTGVVVLRNWRTGTYVFLAWLLFEDLVRKFLGNNMYVYFAKDALIGLVYVSLFVAIRRGSEPRFRPPFLLAFNLFLWLGALQVFNPHSSSILYGFLGLKIYFYFFHWCSWALHWFAIKKNCGAS